jgi:hypothetical protein
LHRKIILERFQFIILLLPPVAVAVPIQVPAVAAAVACVAQLHQLAAVVV